MHGLVTKVATQAEDEEIYDAKQIDEAKSEKPVSQIAEMSHQISHMQKVTQNEDSIDESLPVTKREEAPSFVK